MNEEKKKITYLFIKRYRKDMHFETQPGPVAKNSTARRPAPKLTETDSVAQSVYNACGCQILSLYLYVL